MSSAELVLVLFPYEYEAKDGRLVTIQQNDRYILVNRTNDHWWHVRENLDTKPFYIPARYVRILDPNTDQVSLNTSSNASERDGAADVLKDETAPSVLRQPEGEVTPCWLTPTEEKTEVELAPPLRELAPPLREPESIYQTTEWAPGVPQSSSEPGHDCLDSWQRQGRDEGGHSGGPTSGSAAAEDEDSDISEPHPAGPHPSQDLGVPVWEDHIESSPGLPETKTGASPQDAGSGSTLDLAEDRIYDNIESVESELGLREVKPAPAEPRAETTVTDTTPAVTEKDTSLETPVTDTTPAVTEKDTSPESPVESVPPPAADQVEEDGNPVYVNLPAFRRKPTEPPFDSSEPSGTSPPLQPSSPISSSSLSPSPDLDYDLVRNAPPAEPDSEGWEVHVDEESGQEYFYHAASGQTTWDRPPAMDLQDPLASPRSPRSPSPSPSTPPVGPAPVPPLAASPPGWRASDWERLVDEASGRPYYYNHASEETSWDPPDGMHTHASPKTQHSPDDRPPPLPEEDYPAEDEYTVCVDEDDPSGGTRSHTHPPGLALPLPAASEYTLAHVGMGRAVIPRACLDRSTPAGWTLHVDPDGTWVFTSDHSHEQWIKSLDDRGETYYYLKDGSRSQWNLPEVSQSQTGVGNGSTEPEGPGVRRNWRHSVVPSQEKPIHRRNLSDYGSDLSSSPEMHSQLSSLEKAGILNKTKVSENGKKVRKNWGQSWTVLHGGVLTFHKDPKSAPSSNSNKSNQILTEFTVDLRGATIGLAGKEKSSKKNVIELKSQNGSEYLIQYDTESIISDWHKVIYDTIRQLQEQEQEQHHHHHQQHHSEEEDDVYEKVPGVDDRPQSGQDKKRIAPKQSITSSASEADQKKVRTKLLKFLLKRPTLQSVKEKGYIRENVFGCHLANLCAQEHRTVPSFVEKCIRTVESRGLGIDGIYRVSGNLATIQKLRCKADHEDINIEDGPWDIHVITGSLKLFFRELQEPLFPFSHFNNFIAGIKIQDYHDKVSYMCELVKSLPPANHDTMELLFRHLRRVIEHGEENRMTVQNVAIVFGPTLLKPETESANITMFMIFQNQIVEFILNEFENMFYSG